jgi:hypothetical protein
VGGAAGFYASKPIGAEVFLARIRELKKRTQIGAGLIHTDFDLLEMEKRPGTTAGRALFEKVMDGGRMKLSRKL